MAGTRRSRSAGEWILRAATVLLLVSSSVHYFAKSSGGQTLGLRLYWIAIAVGLVGCTVRAAEWYPRRRRRSSADSEAGPRV